MKTVLILSTILLLLINSAYVAVHIPAIEESATCNGTTYYLTYGHPLGDEQWTYRQLSKWKSLSYTSEFMGYAPGQGGFEIVCDKTKKETRILTYINHLVVSIDGVKTRYYSWEGEATLNNITYGLHYYEEDGTRRFVLNKCLSEAADSCTIIPLDVSIPSSDEEREGIVANPSTNELYLLFDKKIWHVYGNASLNYELLNSLETDQGTYSNANEYYVYSFERNSEYIYFVYGCESYFYCWSMPFTYSTVNQERAEIKNNKEADELSVYIGDELIFTYKGVNNFKCYDGGCKDVQCYVKGCEILK